MGAKIGRNAPCPCGSGRKFKRCHGSPLAVQPNFQPAKRDVDQLTKARIAGREHERKRQHGSGRPVLSAQVGSQRLVIVGQQALASDGWKTFPDFLMSYFKTVIGSDWGNKQVALASSAKSPIFEWYRLTCEYQAKSIPKPGEVVGVPHIGATLGCLGLCYGLYLLQHNVEIQRRLLQRLRSDDPVQVYGAVFEVLVAATMIWAGFDLRLEDESDGTSTHCEFTATSRATGRQFSVEAKVRDPARSGSKHDRLPRALSGALSKKADHDRVIFIDLNEPTLLADEALEHWMHGRALKIRRQEYVLKDAPAAYVILVNFPYRFQLDREEVPKVALLEGFKIDRLKFDATFRTIREFVDHRSVHADALSIVEAAKAIQIPSTFDGRSASKAFGDKVVSLEIGRTYSLPRDDGTFDVGELTSAIVIEDKMEIAAAFHLANGTSVIYKTPIDEAELSAYKESPDTYFGIYRRAKRNVDDPIDFYDFLYETYRNSSKEKLLEFMSTWPDIDQIKDMPQQELARRYCEAITYDAMRRRQSDGQ